MLKYAQFSAFHSLDRALASRYNETNLHIRKEDPMTHLRSRWTALFLALVLSLSLALPASAAQEGPGPGRP